MAIKNLSLETIGLHVGYKDYSKITAGQIPYKKPGVLTCSGISIFGDASEVGGLAAVTICKPDSQSSFPFTNSLHVQGNSRFIGDIVLTGNQTISEDLRVSGTTYASVQGTINVQGWKGFDIKHPTKENYRLRYVCLEGPEGGVYHRGILKDSEFIELPDYWKDLVDTKTITVHLTPIGTYQYLYYTVAKNRIIVKNHSNLPTHCSYIIYGERKDGERLIPEYKGNSPEDYPGKNDQYSIAGYHYDRRTS
jgi:hypothetical protein